MVKIVVDAELRRKLKGLRESVELVDENGKQVGFVRINSRAVPALGDAPEMEAGENPPFDDNDYFTAEDLGKLLDNLPCSK